MLLRSLAMLRYVAARSASCAVGRIQSPDYERGLAQLSRALEIDDLIDWLGFRADVAAELAEVDVLVLPSLVSEAMPMSLLEAMAAGVPVIGTRVDGITDLIDDRVDGLLVPLGDPVALAEAIRQIVSPRGGRRTIADQRPTQARPEIFRPLHGGRRGRDLRRGAGPMKPRLRVFNYEVDPLTMDEAVAQILAWSDIRDGACRYVVTPNVNHTVLLELSCRAASGLSGRRPGAGRRHAAGDGGPALWPAGSRGRGRQRSRAAAVR